uniref:Putative ribonuclease H-like domain-containing protein n=1 Tax=Tanacetum cinerariifolium TaxID=118510 RepID=A0A6L2KLT7_TANCI|nr:putative ribonuclease H-like domain-containing protein [Tanacetum cinerariifolium]
MDSLSPQVVSAAKLPILNPNEFDLWKMRIEQYFLMTDYSLWEVILNGDSPVPTRIVEGILQPIAPTTAEQKLARKNELKARGTLLMAFPDKHQLKFNSHKDAKTLMEAIEKRFEGNTETKKVQKTLLMQQYENFTGSSSESLDQIHDRLQKLVTQLEIHRVSLSQEDVNLKFLCSLLSEWKTHTLIWRNKANFKEQSLDDSFNSLKIYEAEVKHSSSTGTTIQNFAFVSLSNTDSTTDSVSTVASVSAVCAKMHVSSLPNVDSLSNATGRNIRDNGHTSMGFDMSKVECYNCHWKGPFSKECRSLKDLRRNGAAEPQRRTVPVETSTSNALVSQCNRVGSYDWSYQPEEETANYALMAFSSSSSSSDNELAPTSVYDRFQPSDGYQAVPPPYTGTFMKPKPDLVFDTTPTVVETDHPAFTDWVSDSEDESETMAPQIVPSFVQSSEQVKSPRHSVKLVKTSTRAATPKPASPKSDSSGKRSRKACFVCKSVNHLIKDYDYHAKKMAQPTPRTHAHRGNYKQYAPLTHRNPQKHMVHVAVLTQSKPVSITAVIPVSAVVPKIKVTRPRHANPIVTKSKLTIRWHITRSPSPQTSNSPPKVTVVKAPVGNPQHALKDKGVIDSGCSKHMTGNMSYLSNFKELNGGYVAFGGNQKGGKISRKRKIKTCKLDFDDVYFVKELKFNLFSVSQMCEKKNSVLFTDTECLVLSPDFKPPDECQALFRVPRENNMYNVNLKNIVPFGDLTCLFLKETLDESNLLHKMVKGNLVRGLHGKVFENDNTCVACKKGKQHRASCKTKPVSSIDQPLYRLYIDLFKPTFVKSLNKKSYCLVVTDDYSRFTWVFFLSTKDETSPILKPFIIGLQNQLSLKNNDGDAAFYRKEHDFDAKNPEFEVSVSLSSSAQSRKQDDKTKKEAKGKSLVESFTGYRDLSAEFEGCFDNSINEVNAVGTIVPTVGQNSLNSTNTFSANWRTSPILMMKIMRNPKRVHQALKDTSWIEAMQEELLQFKMHKVWILVDLPHRKRAIGTKWVFRNKKYERGTVVRNKVRLVAQGHVQEEGIDYEEVFAPVARIESIKLFLAYASFMGFMVYQMDVKSAFLYGTIEEEVYVCQPPGLEDPDHPDKVYKVVKALYGLHQAPRAWYETLANYLLENGFQRGKIDQTLFIKRQKGDTLLVQIYVDDIIFGMIVDVVDSSSGSLIISHFLLLLGAAATLTGAAISVSVVAAGT